MKMTGDRLRAFKRNLSIQGFEHDLDSKGTGTISRQGHMVAKINKFGEVFDPILSHEQMEDYIEGLRDEVNEYMDAFQKAPKCADANPEYDIRTLLSYDGHELNAVRLPNGDMEFDILTKADGLTVSHSCDSYSAAKLEFALRAGLIDRNKLFFNSRLVVVRSVLTDYLNSHKQRGRTRLSKEEKTTLESVIKQINGIMFPTECVARRLDSLADEYLEKSFVPPNEPNSLTSAEKESVLDKIRQDRQGKQQTDQQKPKTKKHKKSGPEL